MERFCTKCGKITTYKNDSLYVCEMGHDNWINPITGVSAYVFRGSKILFGVRNQNPGKGKLDVPGCFVEVNETAEHAAIREAKEEFGIDITITSCFGTYASVYEGRPALNIIFTATMHDQPITPLDDMSGGDPTWRDIEDLPGKGDVMDDWVADVHVDLLTWWQSEQASKRPARL